MEESTTLARTRKIGGSLVVTLPNNLVKENNIVEDEIIEIRVKKKRKSYFGAIKDMGSFLKEDIAKGQLER